MNEVYLHRTTQIKIQGSDGAGELAGQKLIT